MNAADHALQVLVLVTDMTYEVSSIHSGQLNIHDYDPGQSRHFWKGFFCRGKDLMYLKISAIIDPEGQCFLVCLRIFYYGNVGFNNGEKLMKNLPRAER